MKSSANLAVRKPINHNDGGIKLPNIPHVLSFIRRLYLLPSEGC
jgi:hypothetical protein